MRIHCLFVFACVALGMDPPLAGGEAEWHLDVHFDDGSTQAYEVFERAQYDKDELPLDRVFSKEGDPVVTLITCGGDFNRSLNSYEDNVVAYGVPVDA